MLIVDHHAPVSVFQIDCIIAHSEQHAGENAREKYARISTINQLGALHETGCQFHMMSDKFLIYHSFLKIMDEI